MTSIVFLDVDGVLNSEQFNRTLEEQHRQLGHHEVCECFKLARQIDRAAVIRLNRLVAVTGAKIVISSSWRLLFDPSELHRILGEHGLVAEIIGETPDSPNDPEMLAAYGHMDRIFRGHEIDYWLRKHPEVARFVILDDASDMEMHKNRLVQTDCEEGLLDEHVELAIRMMSWDGKSLVEGQGQESIPASMDEQEETKLPSREPLIVQTPTLLSLVNDQLRPVPSKNTWPCLGKPEELKGAPIGMYHCEFCGEMQLAGVSHLPPQFPSQWEEPFPKIEEPDYGPDDEESL